MSMKNAHACAIYLGEASPLFVAICTQRLRAFRRFFVKSCSTKSKSKFPAQKSLQNNKNPAICQNIQKYNFLFFDFKFSFC